MTHPTTTTTTENKKKFQQLSFRGHEPRQYVTETAGAPRARMAATLGREERDPDGRSLDTVKGCFSATEPYTENQQFYNGFKSPTTDLNLLTPYF